ALKFAIMLNGVTQLIMTKADVLSTLDTVKVCTHYRYKGEAIDYFPYDVSEGLVEPIYRELPGWQQELTEMNSVDQLPEALHQYIAFLEGELEVPITIVSVGPDRSQTLEREGAVA
ncbi:MAG: adenylosuccinate synthetase, partial [Bacteroidota bacterium]